MTELLGLREWLSLDDAVRRLRDLGIENATPLDLFHSYAEADYSLRIEHRAQAFCCPHADGKPYWTASIPATWSFEEDSYVPTNGKLDKFGTEPMKVAPKGWQRGFTKLAPVMVAEPLPFDDNAPEYLPVYNLEHCNGELQFNLVYWEQLLWEQPVFELQFYRPHLDELVARAKGEATSTPGERAQAEQQEPKYLSPTHESYPPELAAAVMLWEGLYVHGEKSQHHLHTQAAKAWLEKNWDRLPTAGLPNAASDAMINRLSTITAPADRKPKK